MQAGRHRLQYERRLDEPVRRADQLHHRDLTALAVGRDLDRVDHQHQGRDALHDGDDQRQLLQRAEHREDLVDQRLLVDDPLDPAVADVRTCSYLALNWSKLLTSLSLTRYDSGSDSVLVSEVSSGAAAKMTLKFSYACSRVSNCQRA